MSVLLSEHLEDLSFVSLPLGEATRAFGSSLEKYGSIQTTQFSCWLDTWAYLTPLLTFPTRYVLLPFGAWTVVICNMARESCLVDALGVSSATGCRAVSARFRPDARSFHLAVAGHEVRSVLAYKDPTWTFFASGDPQSFEDVTAYTRRRPSSRLTPSLVLAYVSALIGLSPPLHTIPFPGAAVGVARSTRSVRVPVTVVPTVLDVAGGPA